MKKLLFVILIVCTVPAFAQKKVKDGIIYKQHPYIEIVKHLAALYEKGDADGLVKLYADSARIYGMTRYSVDTSKVAQLSVPPSRSLAEARDGWQHIFDNWERIKMQAIGEPSGLEYTHSMFTVQSFWLFTLVNKKTKKVAKVEMVLFARFNKAGKIATQIEFYDPASLLAAAR
ncbi:MAG: nuclear transport factor 2 family protein [Mucilaginibacter sp.]